MQRFMLSMAYIEAMEAMTRTGFENWTTFVHNSPKTAYKPATMLTEWEKKALKAHVNYFLRRNSMNGVFRLKATPEGWYVEKVPAPKEKDTYAERLRDSVTAEINGEDVDPTPD